jgi:hypothetical protein
MLPFATLPILVFGGASIWATFEVLFWSSLCSLLDVILGEIKGF